MEPQNNMTIAEGQGPKEIEIINDPEVEAKLRKMKKTFRSSTAECKNRSFFQTRNQKRRTKVKGHRTDHNQSPAKKLITENVTLLKSLGLNVRPNFKKRKTVANIQQQESGNQIVQTITIDSTETQESSNGINIESATSMRSEPTIQISSSVPMTPLALVQEKPIAEVVRADNYVSTFVVVRFIPQTEDQKMKFGLVYNLNRPFPSFPGGSIEEGEEHQVTAKREVFEEIGLHIVPTHIGTLDVGRNACVAIYTADLPYEQITTIKWGTEQRPDWQERLKVVSGEMLDKMVSAKKFMPNHVKAWEFYKENFLNK